MVPPRRRKELFKATLAARTKYVASERAEGTDGHRRAVKQAAKIGTERREGEGKKGFLSRDRETDNTRAWRAEDEKMNDQRGKEQRERGEARKHLAEGEVKVVQK